jgi:hypothetical protein
MIVVSRFARAVLVVAAVAAGTAGAQQAPPLPVLRAPTIDAVSPTAPQGAKYANQDLGIRLSVQLEWQVTTFLPGGKSDGRITDSNIFNVKHRTAEGVDALKLLQIWAMTVKLEPDDLRTAAEYLSTMLQRGREDALKRQMSKDAIQRGMLTETGKIETVTLAGTTYARAKFPVNAQEVGKAESTVYVVLRRRHVVLYTLMYADEKDRLKLEDIVAAIKYSD